MYSKELEVSKNLFFFKKIFLTDFTPFLRAHSPEKTRIKFRQGATMQHFYIFTFDLTTILTPLGK